MMISMRQCRQFEGDDHGADNKGDDCDMANDIVDVLGIALSGVIAPAAVGRAALGQSEWQGHAAVRGRPHEPEADDDPAEGPVALHSV